MAHYCAHCHAPIPEPLRGPQIAALSRGVPLLCPSTSKGRSPCQAAHNRQKAAQAWRDRQATFHASPQYQRERNQSWRAKPHIQKEQTK